MSDGIKHKRVVNRWVLIAGVLALLSLIGWYVGLVVIELGTERALVRTIEINVGNDGKAGYANTYGGVLDQLVPQLGIEVVIDWQSLGLDEREWREKQVEGMSSLAWGGAITPRGSSISVLPLATAPGGPLGLPVRSASSMNIKVTSPGTLLANGQLTSDGEYRYSMEIKTQSDVLMLRNLAEQAMGSDARVTVQGRLVVVTHKDQLGMDWSKAGRTFWGKLHDWWEKL